MGHPDRLADLRARNAGMREQVDSALTKVQRQTDQLADIEQAAAAVTAAASSADGLVSVQVNAVGIATHITLSPTAFDRSTPDKLQRSVLQVLQTAAQRASDARAKVLEPLQIDLAELSGFGELPRLQQNPVPHGTSRTPDDGHFNFKDGAW